MADCDAATARVRKTGSPARRSSCSGEYTARASDPQSCGEIGSRRLSSATRPSTLRAMRAFSKRQAREFYRRLAETRPIPQTELEFISPFTLLVAVVLSAQATDAGVNKATPALFALADTPEEMLALGEERIVELIRTI